MSGLFSDIVIAARRREEKVIADLNAIKGGGDPERSHNQADAAILLFLAEQYPEIYEAYEAVIARENGRWWFA